MNGISGLLCSFIPLLFNDIVSSFVAFRVLGGLGIGGSIPCLFTLISELTTSKWRGVCVNLVASFWMVGAIFTGFVAWLIFSGEDNIVSEVKWPLFVQIISIPPFISFALISLLVPESPAYWKQHGNIAEAERIRDSLQSFEVFLSERKRLFYFIGHVNASNNNMHIFPDNNNDQDIGINSIEHSQQQRIGGDDMDTIEDVNSDLLESTYKLDFAMLALIWFFLSYSSYGVSSWISIIFDDVGFNDPYGPSMLFAFANLPGNVFAILTIDKFGRKNLLLLSLIIGGFFALVFVLVAEFNSNNLLGLVAIACFYNAFSCAAWNALDCLSSECFPTRIRSTAFGFLSASGRFGSIIANIINAQIARILNGDDNDDESKNSSASAAILVTACLSLIFGFCAGFGLSKR